MEKIKDSIKAIIFDMDGTIIDTEHAWKNATLTVLKQHGIETFTPEQELFLATLNGSGLTPACAALKKYFNLATPAEQIMQQKIQIADFYLSQDINFIKGFEAFHKLLQTHAIPTSIATNASPETLYNMTQKLGLNAYFGQHMYCSADVGNKPKPDPTLFLHAAQKLGVSPEQCVVFEDSYAGFMAARAAGMRCIGIKSMSNQAFLGHVHDAIETYHQAAEAVKKVALLPAPGIPKDGSPVFHSKTPNL